MCFKSYSGKRKKLQLQLVLFLLVCVCYGLTSKVKPFFSLGAKNKVYPHSVLPSTIFFFFVIFRVSVLIQQHSYGSTNSTFRKIGLLYSAFSFCMKEFTAFHWSLDKSQGPVFGVCQLKNVFQRQYDASDHPQNLIRTLKSFSSQHQWRGEKDFLLMSQTRDLKLSVSPSP